MTSARFAGSGKIAELALRHSKASSMSFAGPDRLTPIKIIKLIRAIGKGT